jgi:hypothetical protein
MPIPIKILHLVAAIIFGLFAYFQINDIDPEIYDHPSVVDAALWCGFYAFVAFLFLLRFLGKRVSLPMIIIAILSCSAQLGRTASGIYRNLFVNEHFTLTGSQMSAIQPEVELSREFIGALIVLISLILLILAQKKWRPVVKASE